MTKKSKVACGDRDDAEPEMACTWREDDATGMAVAVFANGDEHVVVGLPFETVLQKKPARNDAGSTRRSSLKAWRRGGRVGLRGSGVVWR